MSKYDGYTNISTWGQSKTVPEPLQHYCIALRSLAIKQASYSYYLFVIDKEKKESVPLIIYFPAHQVSKTIFDYRRSGYIHLVSIV